MSKSQHWQAIIEQWKASGLTQKQYCAEQKIKVATLLAGSKSSALLDL
jgi:hypothetical protein